VPKIKIDFVTNSSSSAFVVLFPFIVNDLDQVLQFIPEEKKAEQVYNDILTQNPNPPRMGTKAARDTIVRELTDGYFEVPGGKYNYDYHSEEKREKQFCEKNAITQEEFDADFSLRHAFYEEQRIFRTEECQKYVEEYSKGKEGYVYVFEYGDESGEFFSEMEHGYTFRNLTHLQISHH